MKLLNSPIHTTGDLERTIKKPENGLHVGGFFLLFFFFLVNFISPECCLPSALLMKVFIHKLK